MCGIVVTGSVEVTVLVVGRVVSVNVEVVRVVVVVLGLSNIGAVLDS